jgi:esterase/lipase
MTEELEIFLPGYSVAATLHKPAQPSKHIMLSLIGYTSTKDRYVDFLESFTQELGITSLVFDYSGHGKSPFELANTTPAQHFLEVIAAFDWITARYPDYAISVIGSSYGGYFATMLTEYRTFHNVILRAPAIYKPEDFYTAWQERDRIAEESKSYRRDKQALNTHPLIKQASKYRGKALVLVHENDQDVPSETTDAYIHALRADSYLAEGFPHGLIHVPKEDQEGYKRYIITWLKKQGV